MDNTHHEASRGRPIAQELIAKLQRRGAGNTLAPVETVVLWQEALRFHPADATAHVYTQNQVSGHVGATHCVQRDVIRRGHFRRWQSDLAMPGAPPMSPRLRTSLAGPLRRLRWSGERDNRHQQPEFGGCFRR